jgi:DNA-binding phage protein
MAHIAAEAGITREGAYKSLKPGTKTQMATIMGILDALGMSLAVVPKNAGARDESKALAA